MSIHWIGGFIIYIQKENVTAREYILQALLELLERDEFETISVKQIVIKAGISRSTFYIHFEDKYHLMDCLREDIASRFLAYYEGTAQQTSRSVQTTTLEICKHIFQYQHFYKHEFNQPEYTQNLSDLLAKRLAQVYKDKSYAIFASYGTIGYLTYWVKGNFDIPPEGAAEQLGRIGLTDWSR